MKRLHQQSDRSRRGVTAVMAFLLVWMATAGVLHHTDLFGVSASAAPVAVWNHTGVAVPAADACAACDWVAACLTCPLSSCPHVQPVTTLRVTPPVFVESCILQTVASHHGRAPPPSVA